MQLCATPLLHTHEEVDAHMAERHNSSGVEYFSFHIQPGQDTEQKVLSVLSKTSRSPAQIEGFVCDEFESVA